MVCVSALSGFLIGVFSFIRKRRPLYSQMITIALGCASLGRLYNIVVIITDGSIPMTFNAGVLATMGCFMFLFSANFGEMNSLCDMSYPHNKAISIAALAAPAMLLSAAVVIVVFGYYSAVLRVTYAVEIVFISLASYFNCKHLFIRDDEFGIFTNIRGYNLLSLLLGFLYTAELVLDIFDLSIPKYVVYFLMSACLLGIVPVLNKGFTRWRTPKKNLNGRKKRKED